MGDFGSKRRIVLYFPLMWVFSHSMVCRSQRKGPPAVMKNRPRQNQPKKAVPAVKRRAAAVTRLCLNPRHPPVTVADLALMLEIDLLLGRKRDFRARLQKAIEAAAISALH
jgi:hypothetical protein